MGENVVTQHDGARTSAGIVMIMLRSSIDMGPTLEGKNICAIAAHTEVTGASVSSSPH